MHQASCTHCLTENGLHRTTGLHVKMKHMRETKAITQDTVLIPSSFCEVRQLTCTASGGRASAAAFSTVRASSFAVASSGPRTPIRGSSHSPIGRGDQAGITAW